MLDRPRGVGIISAGLGNVGSVSRMVERAGGIPNIITSSSRDRRERLLILPGVGHYDAGMDALSRAGFNREFFLQHVEEGGYILGICLGMQLLCRESEEGERPGLGLISATVKKFRPRGPEGVEVKIPHMGWNSVTVNNQGSPFSASDETVRFYFVHSFYVQPDEGSNICCATASHGITFCAAFAANRIYGVQFHPEKSHRYGLSLLSNIISVVYDA